MIGTGPPISANVPSASVLSQDIYGGYLEAEKANSRTPLPHHLTDRREAQCTNTSQTRHKHHTPHKRIAITRIFTNHSTNRTAAQQLRNTEYKNGDGRPSADADIHVTSHAGWRIVWVAKAGLASGRQGPPRQGLV